MDQEIAELKREVESLKAVTVDTNKMVHGMRRSQRWRSFVSILWWLTILGLTGASYYFIQPYITKQFRHTVIPRICRCKYKTGLPSLETRLNKHNVLVSFYCLGSSVCRALP